MRHLIIYAHPNPKSFCAKICERIVELSSSAGNKIDVRDLYKDRFNPVLSAKDFESIKSGTIPRDIAKEQNFVKQADLITVVFPLWWTGYPAILKGWIDRVLMHGFAFKHSPKTGITPLLTGKKVQIITTMGASVDEYEKNGLMDAMALTMGDNVWSFCGCDDAGMIVLGEVPGMSDLERSEVIREVESTVLQSLGVKSNKTPKNKIQAPKLKKNQRKKT